VQYLIFEPKKRSKTDPDATMTTSSHSFRMEPAYKQHTAVDDASGVILDVGTTTGEAKQEHGLRRAARRGLANVSIQVYLTAAVINLKRLAALLLYFFSRVTLYTREIMAIQFANAGLDQNWRLLDKKITTGHIMLNAA